MDASVIKDGFALRLADGTTVGARKRILVSGLRDTLPAIPGGEEHWGKNPWMSGIGST